MKVPKLPPGVSGGAVSAVADEIMKEMGGDISKKLTKGAEAYIGKMKAQVSAATSVTIRPSPSP